MKRGSANLILAVVVGVLGVFALLKAFVFKPSFDDKETVEAGEPLFKDFKKEDAALVEIVAPGGKRTELAKAADESDKTKSHWNVATEANARADLSDVNRVLDAVGHLKKGVVQMRSGDAVAKFEGEATQVTVWGASGEGGTPLAQFSIGKIESDWRNAFLKLPNDAAVRKVEGSTSEFEPGVDNTWRDKTIFDRGAADKVAQVEIVGPKGTIVLAREKVMGPKEKPAGDAKKPDAGENGSTDPKKDDAKEEQEVKETVWNLESPRKGRAKKWLCDSIAGYVAKLECESFGAATDKPAELGLDPPQYTVLVKLEGESERKKLLFLGNKSKDGKYAVQLPDQPQVWWIASWKGDYLTKSVEDLEETPPPKPQDDAAKKPDDAKKDEPTKDEPKPAESPAPIPAPAPTPEKPKDDGAAPTPAEPPAPAKPHDGR
jgi:hypothetical protein